MCEFALLGLDRYSTQLYVLHICDMIQAISLKNYTNYYCSFDDDSKMTTDSCSYNTPGSINGWHSPEAFHNGAISKNYHNGYIEKDGKNDKEYKIDKDDYRSEKEYRNEKDDEKHRSPKNINLVNGIKNINLSNGVLPKKLHSRQNSMEKEDKKGNNIINTIYINS